MNLRQIARLLVELFGWPSLLLGLGLFELAWLAQVVILVLLLT